MHPVHPIPIFEDNYVWAIEFGERHVAIVDPGLAQPVIDYLERHQLRLGAILITHGCWDHIGGIGDMLAYHRVPVYGPTHDRVPHLDHMLAEGDTITLGDLTLQVLDTPGHRKGHISFYGDDMLFCGDALFSAGCGKLHDGSYAQLYQSLNKIRCLPDKTQVYCAHEYTAANLTFATLVEPENKDLQRYAEQVYALRAAGKPTVPTTLGLECSINPFLRYQSATVKAAVEQWAGAQLGSDLEIVTALRKWKSSLA